MGRGVGRCFVMGGGGGGGTSNTWPWERCLLYEARQLHNFIIINCAEAHVRKQIKQSK